MEDLETNDSKNNTVTFDSGDTENPTGWKNVATLSSKEKHSSLFNKISTMFSNVRYLYKLLGTTDISALGTVTQALSNLDGNVGDIKGIISSLADCSAATVAGYAADALAVKELNSKLNDIDTINIPINETSPTQDFDTVKTEGRYGSYAYPSNMSNLPSVVADYGAQTCRFELIVKAIGLGGVRTFIQELTVFNEETAALTKHHRHLVAGVWKEWVQEY